MLDENAEKIPEKARAPVKSIIAMGSRKSMLRVLIDKLQSDHGEKTDERELMKINIASTQSRRNKEPRY